MSPVANLDCGSASPFIFKSPFTACPFATPLGVVIATSAVLIIDKRELEEVVGRKETLLK